VVAVTVEQLLIQSLHGLFFGMILLMLSLGLSLIFGIAGVVNFAHGALYTIGAFAAFFIWTEYTSPLVAILLAGVVVGVIGLVIEISVLRPLYGRDPMFQLLATFGLVFILQGAIINIFGTVTKRVAAPEFAAGPVDLGILIYPKYRLFLIGISALLTVTVWLLLTYTDYGVRIRAAAFNAEMVDALGTSTKALFSGTFLFGSVLAGLAGGFAAPVFSVFPGMGDQVIILIFIVVVIGGLGSFRGAVLGSLIVGESVMIGRIFLGELSPLIPYLAMIAILMARPRGLFGTEMEL